MGDLGRYARHISLLSVVLFSMVVLGVALTKSIIITHNPNSGLIPTANGKANKPFVYRTLIAQVSNVITMATPVSVQKKVSDHALQLISKKSFKKLFPPRHRVKKTMYETHNVYRTVVVVIIIYGFLLLYAGCVGVMARELFPKTNGFSYFAPFFALLILLPFIDRNAHYYDFSTLGFTALLLLLLHRKKWVAYILCYTLACFNRETPILITALFFVHYRHALPLRLFIQLMLYQLILWGGSCLYLRELFEENRSWRYPNIPYVLSWELSRFNMFKLLQLVVIWLLITLRWNEMPRILKHVGWFLPLMIVLYLTKGMYKEYRVLYEAFPLVALVTGYSLYTLGDRRREGHV